MTTKQKNKLLRKALEGLRKTALASLGGYEPGTFPERYLHRVCPLLSACDDARDALYPEEKE